MRRRTTVVLHVFCWVVRLGKPGERVRGDGVSHGTAKSARRAVAATITKYEKKALKLALNLCIAKR